MLLSWTFSVFCGITATYPMILGCTAMFRPSVKAPYFDWTVCGVNFLNTCEPNTMAQSNLVSSVFYVTSQRIYPN